MISTGQSKHELLLLRSLINQLTVAETAPGKICLFDANYAVVTDANMFVQNGPYAGQGQSNYAGWVVCNGNNGTQNLIAGFAPLIPMLRVRL